MLLFEDSTLFHGLILPFFLLLVFAVWLHLAGLRLPPSLLFLWLYFFQAFELFRDL